MKECMFVWPVQKVAGYHYLKGAVCTSVLTCRCMAVMQDELNSGKCSNQNATTASCFLCRLLPAGHTINDAG